MNFKTIKINLNYMWYYYLFRQKKGVNKMSTVKSSKRPISIKKLHHHLPMFGKFAKLFTGLKLPKAGPTLPKLEAAKPIAD